MSLKLTKPLIILDLETTGTNLVRDKIVEYCMYKIYPDGTKEIRTQLLNPGIPIPAEVSKIHGIYDKDVKDKPLFKDIAKELYAFIDNADLGGYNSNKFDIPILIEEFLKAGIDFQLKDRCLIDVQNIFHKMEPRHLAAAYKFYCGKTLHNAHSAEADTVATYQILEAQIERYKDVKYTDKEGNETYPIQNDVEALHDFSTFKRNVDLVGHIVYNQEGTEVFNFGKHKGKAVEKVFEKEPSYFDWIMKSDFPQLTKKLVQFIKLRSAKDSHIKSSLF